MTPEHPYHPIPRTDLPRPTGALSLAGSAHVWFRPDAPGARALSQPRPILPGLPAEPERLTADPRRYGFHGTLRAPFRPAPGLSTGDIAAAVAALAARLPAIRCDGLALEDLNGFLALVPTGCEAALMELGAAVVEGTEALRAPLSMEEIARRRPETLSPRQRELLNRWGYPFVFEEFRPHLTLTGELPDAEAAAVEAALAPVLAPLLPRPFVADSLCLFGEAADGRFRLLHRYPLAAG